MPKSSQFQEEEAVGAPAWTVTFADMMSLLLCLFVLMYALKHGEQSKFKALAAALEARFGSPIANEALTNDPIESSQVPVAPSRPRAIDDDSTAKPASASVRRLSQLRAGSQPTLGVTLHFDETSDELTAEARSLLGEAARQFRGKANKIEIRGHATGRPPEPGDRYVDEWDLSFARCRRTMQCLVEQEGIDPQRLRLNSAGKNEPLHLSTDQRLQSENGRVEIFMLSEYAEDLLGTEGERAERLHETAARSLESQPKDGPQRR